MLKLCNFVTIIHFSKNIRNKNINTRLHDMLSNRPKEEVHLKDIRKMRMEKRTKHLLAGIVHKY